MKVVPQSFEIVSPNPIIPSEIMLNLERVARTCYKSEDKIAPQSADLLIKQIIDRGHEAMLEHSSITVKFITDRGVSHEIVRHRLASYAQESTRYCNYSKDKFFNEITVICPIDTNCNNPHHFDFADLARYPGLLTWLESVKQSEKAYFKMLEEGHSPQIARSVLPNSLKTEIVMTANLREWRHFLKLRTAENAHPQMRALVLPLLRYLQAELPTIFEDI